MKVFALLAIALLGSDANGQEHPYLSRFELTEQQGAVRVEWTMIGGNTCFDIEVWRGLDPSALERIGTISGLCGHIVEPVDYAFNDGSPPEFSLLFYRLVLGSAGPSSIKSLDFRQVTSSEIRLVPDVNIAGVNVYLDLSNSAEVELRCWTVDGKLIITKYRLVGRTHFIPMPTISSGVIIVQATSNGRMITGRCMF